VEGTWKTFKYSEPFYRHNRGKHWVDDVNNRQHDPIGLESAWATKWWPNQQFTFILLVAEANAVQARARATNQTAMLTLEYQKKLAMQMMQNKLGDNGVAAPSPKPTRASILREHVLTKHAKKAGKMEPLHVPIQRNKVIVCPSSLLRLRQNHQGLLFM
jgi:hypothetical protein